MIQELQPRSPKAHSDLGQALLWLCSVRVEGTAVPGLQFWVGGARGAAQRLHGLMAWLRIYRQGRIAAEPGDAATMGIKSKKLLQTPPENTSQVSWTSHTQSTSVTSISTQESGTETLSEATTAFHSGNCHLESQESPWSPSGRRRGTRPDLQLQPAKSLNTGVSAKEIIYLLFKTIPFLPLKVPCSAPELFLRVGRAWLLDL